MARFNKLFGAPLDYAQAVAVSERLFKVLDQALGNEPFLAGAKPTIADIAMYTYTAHAPEGQISLEPYANIRAWIGRIEGLPGFVPMQGMAPPA
jgi:glutathione S-transferase